MSDFSRENLSEQLIEDFKKEDNLFEGESASRAKIFIPLIAIVVSIIIFASYAIFTDKIAISKGSGEKAMLVRADTAPVRVKPDDPGGMHIANRDKRIYDAISGKSDLPKVIHLLPAAEKVMDREHIKQSDVGVAELLVDFEVNMPKELKKKPEAVVIVAKKDNTLVAKQELMSRSIKILDSNSKISNGNIRIIPVPRSKTLHVVSKKNKTGYRIQLGSYRTSDDAKENWSKIKNKHNDLLDRRSLYIEKADLGNKGIFYRLQLKGFGGESRARKLCQQLVEQKQGCFVVKK